MRQVIQDLAQTLRVLAQDLSRLQAEDEATLARLGAALEAALSAVPADRTQLAALLALCLEALQGVYLKTVPVPQSAVAAAAAAIVAAERSLHTCTDTDPVTLLETASVALQATLSAGCTDAALIQVPADVATTARESDGMVASSATAASDPAPVDDDTALLIHEFLVESYENLDQLDRDLIALEQQPSDREILSRIFRTIHTIKGTCGFLGFSRLESLTHVGENLLSRLRDGELRLSPEITSALLAMVDAVREILANIEARQFEGDGSYADLIDRLSRLQQDEVTNAPAARSCDLPGQYSDPPLLGEVLVETGRIPLEEVSRAVEQQQRGDPRLVGEILVDQGLVQPAEVREAFRRQKEARSSVAAADSSIRVDVGLLDRLMNLVGELVLARNQIVQFTASQPDTALIGSSQRLNLITAELQQGVMKTRMQPIGNIWSKFPRVVRDMSLVCGKQITLEMEGKETELDKTIIEAIKDPLTHVIRNCVDHGIEKPDARVANGKRPEGRILLCAFHEGGQVNIEISDDGAGIDPARIQQKALDRNLITTDQAVRLSDRELVSLVFLPGFSTAEKISNVSGRGVGMDVVKTNIEKIGGSVDIQSQIGEGTTLRIKIPLTLAIIPALIITSGGDRYAIPQVNLMELVRLEGDQGRGGIEMIHGAPVYRLRGRLLPLVHLNQELELGPTTTGSEGAATNIVVLQADDRQFGLVVDCVNDTEEIVVKPLAKQLKGLTTYAGATIMGDGTVALILDVLGLAQRAHVLNEARDRALTEVASHADEQLTECRTLLLVAVGGSQRMAIPLSAVSRLEEFSLSTVECAQNQDAVQYRGQILPLIFLADALGIVRGQESTMSDPLQVVVYLENGRSVGLVVDRILDIVEERVDIEQSARSTGILGSVVIHDRITDLLDVRALVRAADPSFGKEPLTISN